MGAIAAILLCGAAQDIAAQSVLGAGSSLAYPVLSRWSYDYNKATGVKVNYQSIGSGGGIKQIKEQTIDFGVSDAPLKPAELERAGLVQWPVIMSGVVPVVNIPGVGANQLVLSGSVLANIYLGKITRWNDARIKALNPAVDLPNEDIAVVHRADGSGTTWIFTNYLTKVSVDWATSVGTAKAVAWPVGLGGKGNEGVAAFISKVPDSIGYIEYTYARQNHMALARLINRAGNIVTPTIENFAASAAGADWKHSLGYYVVLTDQPGANSWPITGASFILMHKKPSRPGRALNVLKFLDWSYKIGAPAAKALGYVPVPQSVVRMVKETWHKKIQTDGHPIW